MSVKRKLAGMGAMLLVSAILAAVRGQPWHWLICTALGFSWVGDALLLSAKNAPEGDREPFLMGLGAFALAQIAYIVAFAWSLRGMPTLHGRVPGGMMGAEHIGAMLPIFLLAGALFWALVVVRADKPWLEKIAALLYALLVCAMAAMASAASLIGARVAWPLILGGALFVLSDGTIAAHIYQGRIESEKRYAIIVWGTYLPAQFLLMLGASWLH